MKQLFLYPLFILFPFTAIAQDTAQTEKDKLKSDLVEINKKLTKERHKTRDDLDKEKSLKIVQKRLKEVGTRLYELREKKVSQAELEEVQKQIAEQEKLEATLFRMHVRMSQSAPIPVVIPKNDGEGSDFSKMKLLTKKAKVEARLAILESVEKKGGDKVGDPKLTSEQDLQRASGLFEMNNEKAQLKARLKTLTHLGGETLMEYASGLGGVGDELKSVYGKRLLAQRELQKMISDGFGEDDQKVKDEKKAIVNYEKNMVQGIGLLKELLKAQRDAIEAKLSLVNSNEKNH